MIVINISGGNKFVREELYNVSQWCIKKMFSRYKNLSVEIELCELYNKEGLLGVCNKESNREYLIEIDKNQNIFATISTLIHEFIHVRQYAKRELDYNKAGDFCWKGKNYPNCDYTKQPWEKEAYKLEKVYALEYFKEKI